MNRTFETITANNKYNNNNSIELKYHAAPYRTDEHNYTRDDDDSRHDGDISYGCLCIYFHPFQQTIHITQQQQQYNDDENENEDINLRKVSISVATSRRGPGCLFL